MQEAHATVDRVRAHTDPRVNARFDRALDAQIAEYLDKPPESLQRRLAELDREWTVDGAAITSLVAAGSAMLAGALRRRATRTRGVLAVAAIELALVLLTRAGRGPQTAILRRLGFRTKQEIATERAELERMLAEWMRIRGA